MDQNEIDLLKKKYDLQKPERRGYPIGRVFLSLLIVGGIMAGALSYGVLATGQEDSLSFFGTLKRLVSSSEKLLQGEADDRINLLVVGVGGEGHEGPELTDTIIFGSYKPSSDEVGMLSLPRDLTVEIPGYDWRKINHVNAYAELDHPGEGMTYTTELIGELLGQEIHYWVKVDFQGFADLIDDLGGVDIYVETAFTDYQYPTDDYLTQTISFAEGWTHLDGETALMFVRSRHGTNGEGSDFARARRQQQVMLAVKEKVLTAGTLLNPNKVNKILSTLNEHVETNLSTWEIIRLASLGRDVDPANIVNTVLDNSADSPLYETIINGAYVLLPKNDDWGPIRRMAANVFYASSDEYQIEPPPVEAPQFVKVEIQNGTTITGYAFRTSQILEGQGFEVEKIGNAAERGYENTVIYDLTGGQNPDELKLLQEILEADVALSATGWIYTNEIIPKELSVTPEEPASQTTEDNIDFLVILGETGAGLVMR